jgi:D-3-phosphoglycerate dehydrogenase
LEFERGKLKEIGAELVEAPGTSEAELMEAARDADAVITCYAEVTGRVIAAMEKCKVISKTGIGVNNIDVATATARGIKVTNVPDYCIDEVSDHALAFILTLARKIPFLDSIVKKGSWSFKDQQPMYRLSGKVIGLVGYGRIARLLAEKVKPLELHVLVYDPFVPAEVIAEKGDKKVSLEELLQEADFVSLHAPLTEETRGIMGQKAFELMKSTSYIINTSRGPLIDEQALYQALKAKKIAGAALDVLVNEKYDPGNPLFGLDNIIFTPHSGFYSEEATQELREKVMGEVTRVLTNQSPKYLINKEVGNVS